jgi:hypothetical protein
VVLAYQLQGAQLQRLLALFLIAGARRDAFQRGILAG